MSRVAQPRIVIVGASAAGLKAAARARRLLPDASIVVIDESASISFGACGLPYFVAGEIDEIEALASTPFGVARDAAYFAGYKNIEVRVRCRAERLDVRERALEVVGLDSGERASVPYDELVLATGARPRELACADGGRRALVGSIKTMEEAAGLRRGLEAGKVQSVVIVGAGALGCEMAEALRVTWGCEAHVVEGAAHVLPSMLDAEMAGVVERHMLEQKVHVQCGRGVTRVACRDLSIEIEMGESSIVADRAIFAMGVTPRTRLARQAGIEVGRLGGIVTDEHLRTSAPHVYAAGDCVEVSSAVHGGALLLPLGSIAARQGRVVGDNLAGRASEFPRVAGSAVLRVFDLNVACTGLTRAAARRAGVTVACVWGTFRDKPHYYPEGNELLLSMVYEPATRRLVGLQAIGKADAVRSVDVFGNLLLRRGTIEDLIDAEYAYSPPYASSMDPLHAMAAMAEAQERDGVRSIAPGDGLDRRVVVDVREPSEMEEHPIACARLVKMPLGELRSRFAELPDSDVMMMCEKGQRGLEAARFLIGTGRRNVAYAAGGRILWEASCCTRSS